MRRRSFLIVIMTAALAVSGCAGSASADALVSIGAGLQGPDGTRAAVYARGLKNVSALAFDTDGRLWAATASYDAEGNDDLYVVTKAGSKPIDVMSMFRTPLGLLWYHGLLYVSSRSRVDAYGGFSGSRFTTHRTVLTLPSEVGETNELVLSPDDWQFPSYYGQSTSAYASAPKPTATLDKHSAASGVAIVTGEVGSRVGTAALVAEWSDGKVLRVALRRSGSTYTGVVHPFLTGLKSPVPVILHDRSVLVGDRATGIVDAVSGG